MEQKNRQSKNRLLRVCENRITSGRWSCKGYRIVINYYFCRGGNHANFAAVSASFCSRQSATPFWNSASRSCASCKRNQNQRTLQGKTGTEFGSRLRNSAKTNESALLLAFVNITVTLEEKDTRGQQECSKGDREDKATQEGRCRSRRCHQKQYDENINCSKK